MEGLDKVLICPTCGAFARLTQRAEMDKNPPEAWVFVCENYPRCDSYVGCHRGTQTPLGTLAGPELRLLRRRAHSALDWHWKRKGGVSRDEAYRMLAEVLEAPFGEAHIGSCNEEQCRLIVQVFNGLRPWKMPHR